MKSLISSLFFVAILLLLAGYGVMGANWTPPAGPPTDNNSLPPINVSADTQTKSGNFIANILVGSVQMRSPQYCDANGANCWNPASTSGASIGGGDTLIVGSHCFQPAHMVACNWNWSGDGNDNAMYLVPMYENPSVVCKSASRTYQYHSTVLSGCFGNRWLRSDWVRRGTTRSFDRTVTCVVGTTGAPLPDSSCTGTKPATSCTDTVSVFVYMLMGMPIPPPSSSSCPA